MIAILIFLGGIGVGAFLCGVALLTLAICGIKLYVKVDHYCDCDEVGPCGL